MFYDIRVMNSERMGAVWRTANNLEVESNTDDVNLRKVCAHISKWTDYEDNSRRHLSLRASSLLVNGAAKVLKKQLVTLYDDCVQLTEEMFKELDTNSNVNESLSGSTSTNSSTSNDSNTPSKSKKCSSRKRRRTSDISSPPSNTVDGTQKAASRTYILESDEDNTRSRSLYEIDQECQTTRSYITNKKLREEQEKEKRNNKTTKKPNEALVFVYENESRVPTKIICSEININALRLYTQQN